MNRPAKEFNINSSRLYPLQTVFSRARLYASATVAEPISVLINKRRLLAYIFAATLLCSKMSFGTRTSLCFQAGAASPSIRFARFRVSVFCLVNNLNEGEEGDNRVAVALPLQHENPTRDPAHIEPSRQILPRARYQDSLTRLTLFSGQVQSYQGTSWYTRRPFIVILF